MKVAGAIAGDLLVGAFLEKLFHLQSRDALFFGIFDPKGLAPHLEAEAPAHRIIECQLVAKVHMELGVIAVRHEIFAGADIVHGRAQHDKRAIKTAAVKGDKNIGLFDQLPKIRQDLFFIARDIADIAFLEFPCISLAPPVI